MAAASYYSNQDFGQAHTSDNVPLLPTNEFSQRPVHQTPCAAPQLPHHPAPYDPPLKPVSTHAYTPLGGTPSNGVSTTVSAGPNRLQGKGISSRFKKYIRYFRWLRILSQAFSTAFNGIMFASMVYMVIIFYRTKDKSFDGQPAWHPNPKTWPTIMLLVGSGLTLAIAVGTLMAYCLCADRARQSWKIVLARYAIHIGVWLIITFLYRYEKGLHNVNDDLWGWSCGNVAKKLQEDLHADIDFSRLCGTQVRYRGSVRGSSLTNTSPIRGTFLLLKPWSNL